MQRVYRLAVGALLVAACVGCGGYGDDDAAEDADEDADATTLPLSPLAEMVIEFEGDHTETEIRQRLDEALALYDLEPTDDNYSRVGDVLAEMRRDHAVAEMTLLDCVIRGYVPGFDLEFEDVAVYNAVAFATTGRCD